MLDERQAAAGAGGGGSSSGTKITYHKKLTSEEVRRRLQETCSLQETRCSCRNMQRCSTAAVAVGLTRFGQS
jgi:hypothetical protein